MFLFVRSVKKFQTSFTLTDKKSAARSALKSKAIDLNGSKSSRFTDKQEL